ncbi:MAG: hypothetical protein K6T75_07205 [Acetobacteraceae bacterium]|nr:hypothetical protein [Acetobacteraceae bacterium]
MDWGKARAILIFAFALMNAFLAYRIWVEPGPYAASASQATEQEVRAVVEKLAERGLVVEARLPLRNLPMPILEVSPRRPQPLAMLAAFTAELAGPGPLTEEVSPGVHAYRRGEAVLSLVSSGAWSFRRPRLEPDQERSDGIWSLAEARRVAEEFLKSHGGLPADARLDLALALPAQGLYRIEFVQVYQGWPMFMGRFRVGVGYWGVELAEGIWVNGQGFRGERKPVVSAAEALRRWADLIPAGEEVTVKEVSLGYFTPAYDSDLWQAVPVWRIRAVDGRSWLLNAWTGQLERSN